MTDLLATAMMSLAKSAIDGLEVIPANIREHLKSPVPEWTKLAKISGYSEATKQIKRSLNENAQGALPKNEET